MLANLGSFFADKFRKIIPDSFIFALVLTLITGILGMVIIDDINLLAIIKAWYKGFWDLLQFSMQMVLILVTGYAIAISGPAEKAIDILASKIKKPIMVYIIVVFMGGIFVLISWGFIVLTAVLARELAARVKKVDYRLLTACVYVSFLPWHGGLSGSIPLTMNTPNNFLMESGIVTSTIPTSLTLASNMNIFCNAALLITLPVLMILLVPQDDKVLTFDDLREGDFQEKEMNIAEEAEALKLPGKNLSDILNNSLTVQILISLAGLWYIIWHFSDRGFDLNLNIMNFIFIIIGLFCHKTPARYAVAMKRSCSNVSGIILQFPFYAGIMGIMIYTGLGKVISDWIVGFASVTTFPFISLMIGGIMNIFIPSGGGEWAVIGPTIMESAQTLGAGLPPDELARFLARSSMAAAYGDAWTNMIQPFWTLTFLPVVAKGIRIQARDIMGYTFIALIWSGIIFSVCVSFLPF
jgi:short-chain fatty acids transporter